MASLRVHPAALIFLLLHVILLATFPVYCDDEEDHLLQGINSFRQTARVPTLSKHDKADCLADKIADEMEDQPCPRSGAGTAATAQPQLSNYPDLLKKCDIDINTTHDGLVLPVCVPDRVATLVLTNYTQSQNVRYLNDSRYTGIGIGKEDDWTVLVLTTNTPGGRFESAASMTDMFGLSFFLLCLFSSLFLLLVN